MKRFLLNITKIIAFVFIIQIVLIIVVLVIEKSYSFRVSDSINKVVIGHSMTECAIDDKIYKGSINVSQSGTGLNYSYVKLRKILNENPQIDTVIFGIKPDDLSVSMNHEFNTSKINEKIPKYFFLFNTSEMIDYCGYSSFYSSLCLIPLEFVLNLYTMYCSRKNPLKSIGLGHYKELHGTYNLSSNHNNYVYDETYKNLFVNKYLNRIISLCIIKNVKLIFITTPIYGRNDCSSLVDLFREKKVEYINFSDFCLSESDFYDTIHLNTFGSNKFSIFLFNYYE